MIVRPFKASDVDLIELQPRQAAAWRQHAAGHDISAAVTHGGWSVFHGEQLLLCGGVIARRSDEPLLWSLISVHASRHMLGLLRVTERFLQVCGHPFVYATTECEFASGCRFLELLKFERLTDADDKAVVMQPFVDGVDHYIYERVL